MIFKHSAKAILACAFVFLGAFACKGKADDLPDGLYAKMDTSKGEIVLKLEFEKAPLTVSNFVGLSEGSLDAVKGKHFYDGLTFHRVEANFMIQGGDPEGTGTGGPGYSFQDEFDPDLKHDKPGTLSMANSGANTNGSQFFITHVSTPWLDGKHSVFGSVVKGQEVVNAIQKGDLIKKVTILRYGSKAKAFKSDQKAFDGFQAALKEKNAAAAKEKIDKQMAQIDERWKNLQGDANGIRYAILKQGSGSKPAAGNTVSILYRAMLADGTEFDSSKMSGNKPLSFQVGVGKIVKFLDEPALDMKKGEKRLIVVHPDMAYGAAGAGNVIPPYAFVIFELELIDISK
jgi:peptidyl-prolyl cis-trans isomerase A (cyclophilin A)